MKENVCPKCEGKQNPNGEVGEVGEVGCCSCDFTGTLEGFEYMNREMMAAYSIAVKEQREEEWEGFWLAFKIRCKTETDFKMNRAQRWFYTAKFVICFLLDIRQPEKSYPDDIEVCCPYSEGSGNNWESVTMRVGWGYFRNWFWHSLIDGDCDY